MAGLRKNMALDGPLMALSEDEAHKQFPGITTVICPGLIVGPGAGAAMRRRCGPA